MSSPIQSTSLAREYARQVSGDLDLVDLDAHLLEPPTDRRLSLTSAPKASHRSRWASRRTFIVAAWGAVCGLGNVWRFPYQCYSHGGGSFWIPYLVAMVVLGIPLLALELSLGQKMQVGAVDVLFRVDERCVGIGWFMIAGAFYLASYYSVIMAWAARFIVLSFQNPLPWTDDPEAFFYEEIVGAASTISETSTFVWEVVVCSLFVWLILYLCVRKGVKSSGGYLVWFTVPFSLSVLLILFFRGVSLEGARDGIKLFLKPTSSVFTDPSMWADAVAQLFFSLSLGIGAFTAFGSYNDPAQHAIEDSMIILAANFITSLVGGFAAFAVLGHMAFRTGTDVASLTLEGPGIVLVEFSYVMALMPGAQFFCLLFFLMILCLGINSAFALTEAVCTALRDFLEYNTPAFKDSWISIHIPAIVCGFGFVASLIYCTDGGIWFLKLTDHFVGYYILLPVGLTELIILGWLYGAELHGADMYTLTGELYSRFWFVMWKWVGPLFLVAIIIMQVVLEFTSPLLERTNFPYPWWAKLIGVIEVAVPFIVSTYIFIKANQVRDADLWAGTSAFQLEQELEKDFAIGDSLLADDY